MLAALYRRVSTDQQENSLVVQEALNDAYAQRMGLPVVPDVFADEDVSGSIPFLERAGGAALMRRLRLGGVTDLITAKQDRLGRDTMDTIRTIRAIWELGITPHFPGEGGALPRTPQNELLFEIKASVAQYERNLIAQRTLSIMRHKFAHGELTGHVPYGYDAVYQFADGSTHVSAIALNEAELAPHLAAHGPVLTKRLQPNATEQAAIRQLAAWRQLECAPGQVASYGRVAEWANARGLRTKQGQPWGQGNVRSVLTNRHTLRLLQTPATD